MEKVFLFIYSNFQIDTMLKTILGFLSEQVLPVVYLPAMTGT